MILNQRLKKVFSALLLGSGQEFIFQFLSILIWISEWGIGVYSEWLLLFLVPNLLIRGNAGIFHTSTSEMIRLYSIRDQQAAASAYSGLKSAQRLYAQIMAFFYVAMATTLIFLGGFEYLDAGSLILLSVLLFLQFLFFQHHQECLTVLKAEGLHPVSVHWQNAFRTVFIVAMLALPFALSLELTLLVAVTGQLAVLILTRRFASVYISRLQTVPVTRKESWDIFKKGLQFSSFPLFQTLLHTASVWVVGILLNPTVGAAWHLMRTLSRSPAIVTRVAEQGIRWELSELFAKGEFETINRLVDKSLRITILLVSAAMVILLLLGETVFQILSSNELVFEFPVFALLCAGATLFSIAQIYLAIPFSLNFLDQITRQYAVLSIFTLALVIPASYVGLGFLALLLLLSELAFLWISRKSYRSALATNRLR